MAVTSSNGPSVGRKLSYDFSSRKFLVFVYVAVSSSWLLWTKVLPAEEYVQVILWVTILYFGANLWQTGVGKPTSTSFKIRLFSRKFILLLALLVFFTLATVSQVMPAAQYSTLVIWMTGIYFGIDIGELHAFRGLRGVGKMFRDDVDPGAYVPPYPTPDGGLPPSQYDDRVTASQPISDPTDIPADPPIVNSTGSTKGSV